MGLRRLESLGLSFDAKGLRGWRDWKAEAEAQAETEVKQLRSRVPTAPACGPRLRRM